MRCQVAPEKGGFVAMKNPKRYSRFVLIDPRTGQQNVKTAFSDFDLIEEGVIEVKPVSFFFLDWLSTLSQINYCYAYVSWLHGKKAAQAAQAGITVAPASALSDLLLNPTRRSHG